MIVCGPEAEAAEFNRRCQEYRQRAGARRGEGVQTPGGVIFVGDPVRFTAGSRLMHIEKGEVGTVIAVKPKRGTVTVTFDNGNPPTTVPVRDCRDVRLSYAVTDKSARANRIADTSYVLLGPEMSAELLTQVRGTPRVFLDHARAQREKLDMQRVARVPSRRIEPNVRNDRITRPSHEPRRAGR